MEIFIQARKDGYNVLYPKPTPKEFFQFANDIQSVSARNDEKYYGKSFYSIAFSDDGCIFSKYVLGYDVQRNNLGNIGISIYISNTKKLSGENIISLLDELLKIYCSYCPNYYILNNKEDWGLFTNLANSYDSKLIPFNCENDETFQSGNKDSAYLYFKDSSQLNQYFDDPFQEEYYEYRQVLFIHEDLKDKPENPLHAVRHSENDLTGRIDLDNPKYTLFFNQNAKGGVRIAVKVNGSFRSNKNKIRRKKEIEITWSKQYYQTKIKFGKWTEISDDYLIVNDNDKSITVREIDLIPEARTFNLEVIIKRDSNRVSDAEIQVDTQPWQLLSNITFYAEDLGREHKIVARKRDNLSSDVIYFKPQDYPYSSINLTLVEKKVVKIYVTEAEGFGNRIDGFKVWIQGKQNYLKMDEVEFKDSEISQTWRISVSKEGFQQSEDMSYCPQYGANSIYFKLKKQMFVKKDSEGKVDPNPQKPFWGQINTFIRKPAILASILVCVIAITLLFFLTRDDKTEKPKLTSSTIESYLDDDSLMMKQLKAFQEDWNKQEPEIKKSGGSFFSWIFGGDDKDIKLDSTDVKLWDRTKQSIDSAINFRKLIDQKLFKELKKYCYRNHSNFNKIILEIPDTCIENVKLKLNDISNLTLSQIEDSINHVLKKIESEKTNEETQTNSTPENVKKETPDKKNTVNNTSDEKNKYTEKEWEKDFWNLIVKKDLNNNDFKTWFKMGKNFDNKNLYKQFYMKLKPDLSSNVNLNYFIVELNKLKGEDRNKLRKISDLEKYCKTK